MKRHSVLEVSKEALLMNLELIQTFLFDNQKVIAVVKADAYGHGAVQVAKLYQNAGVDFFSVASIGEAIELRENGIQSKILVLSPFFEDEIESFIDYDIIATLTEYERAKSLAQIAAKKKKQLTVHIKVDTGMGRLGLSTQEAYDEILKIKTLPEINMEGIFSHFPVADALDDFTLTQIESLKNLIERLKEKNIGFSIRHIANTSGLIAYNDSYFNRVRPGIVLYGTYPSKDMKDMILPETTIQWKSRLVQTKTIQAGDTISYGKTFKAEKRMSIGVVPVGYADGFSTLNSSKGMVYIHGQPCPVLGRVCMDYFMVDLGSLTARTGDEVILYGNQDGIRPDEVAERTGLISYEILTNISSRIKREYVDNF